MPDGTQNINQQPYIDRVYAALKDNLQGFDKTPEQFKQAMQDSGYASRAYAALKENVAGFDRSQDDFYNSVGLKKKETSQPVSNVSSNGLNEQVLSTPSLQYSFASPSLREHLQKADKQNFDKETKKQQELSNHLKQLINSLPESSRKIMANAPTDQGEIRPLTQEEKDHWDFMRSPTGKLLAPIAYLGSKATKGAIQMAKGGAWVASKLQPDDVFNQAGQIAADVAFDKADQKSNFGLTQGDQANLEHNKLLSNVGGIAEILPSIAGAESTGGATFFLQGAGQGKEVLDQAEKNGAVINPHLKDAFILGSGVVNKLLMGDLGNGLFGKLPAGVKADIVGTISADALKKAAGKELTGDAFTQLLEDGAKKWSDKLATTGINAIKHYNKAVVDLSALQGSNFLLKKGVDVLNDKPVFNENLGDLASGIYDTATKQAPFFGALGTIGDLGKLTPYSNYKNSVVESLMRDPSEENVNKVKEDLYNHGFDQNKPDKWSPEEMDATFKQVDNIARIAKSLPRDIKPSKQVKAVDLINGRDELVNRLNELQKAKESHDPAVKDIPSKEEQLLIDKIDQANDKLKSIAYGKKVQYVGDDETGKYQKIYPDGKKENISKSRYDLEQVEKQPNDKLQEEQGVGNTPTEAPVLPNQEQSEAAPVNEGIEPIINKEEPNNAAQEGNIEQNSVSEHQGTAQGENIPENGGEIRQEESQQTGSSNSVEPETQEQVTHSEKAKAIADKIRSLKTQKGQVYGGLQGVGAAVYDGALETAATVIEQGGKLADAIKAAVDHIKANSGGINPQEVESHFNELLGGLDELPKEVSQPEEKAIGVKKVINDALRGELGIKPLDLPKRLTMDEGLVRGKELVDNGDINPLDVISKALAHIDDPKKVGFSADEELAMNYYERQLAETKRNLISAKLDLEDELKNNPDNQEAKGNLATITQQLLNWHDLEARRLDASQIMGNAESNAFRSRQLATNEQGEILNAIDRIKTIYGSDIPDDVKKELAELQQKFDEIQAKNEKLEKQIADEQAKANVEVFKRKKSVLGIKREKKTAEQYSKERASILEDLKRDFKKSFGQANLTLPGVPQLNAIAPHVLRLVRSFSEQGIDKLDDVLTNVHDALKDVVSGITKDDIRDIIAGKYRSEKTRPELEKQIADLRAQARNLAKIAELEKGIVAKTKAKGEASPEVKALQKQVRELRKKLGNENPDASIEDIKKEVRTLQSKIDKGEFFKLPNIKRTWENNPEWIKNNKERIALKQRLRVLEKEAMNSKKSKMMRAMDWTNRWGRRVIFFASNAVYTKLASSAVLGSFLHRLPEQAVGKVASKAFPLLAKGAPIEGDVNLSAEAKWYKEFMNPVKAAKSTWSIIKSGDTELSKELSTRPHENHIPFLDLFAADGHIIIKDPVRRATFEAAFANQMKWYADNGIDATHPLMLESARQAAWKRAEYEIFQNSPKRANIFKQYLNELEKKGIENVQSASKLNKLKGDVQYAASAIYNFFIPINTVPTNMIGRSMLAFKLPYNLWKALDVNSQLKKGIDNLTTDEKEALLLHIKKGAIAAAYWTLGFYLAGKSAGGLYTKFYSDKERDKTVDVPDADYLNLFGVSIPKEVQHTYQFQAMQMGATWGIVHDHYVDDKGESQTDAILRGTYATGGAIAEGIPTVKQISNVKEAITTPQGEDKFIKDFKIRVGVQKAKDAAKLMGYNLDNDEE
jgi:ribosomal protein L19E